MVLVLSSSKARERSEVYAPLEAAPIFGLGYSHPPPGPKANRRIRQIQGPADGAIASHVRHEKINSFSQDNTPIQFSS
jgi:hypothetical protein